MGSEIDLLTLFNRTRLQLSLGQQFATVEGITLMSMLFQKFSFELIDPDTEPGYVPGLTLPMADGLKLRVKRRVF
jgi:cytochrome P450